MSVVCHLTYEALSQLPNSKIPTRRLSHVSSRHFTCTRQSTSLTRMSTRTSLIRKSELEFAILCVAFQSVGHFTYTHEHPYLPNSEISNSTFDATRFARL